MSDWYYAENNEQRGPVLESELKGLLATKKLPGDTLVWKEGMANWTQATQVASLGSAAATTVTSVASTPNPESVTPVTTSDIVGTPEALEVDVDDAEKNKIFGIIAYIGVLCLVPLFAVKDSPFAKYHANQGLTLFLCEIAIWVVLGVLGMLIAFIIPMGFGVVEILFAMGKLAPFVLAIIGIINAAKGKCVPLPLIGGIKLIK